MLCRSLCSPWQYITEEARLPAFAVACSAMDVVVPSRLQQGALLVLAAALVAAGVGGGQWFMENDYVVYGVSVSPPATLSPKFLFSCRSLSLLIVP